MSMSFYSRIFGGITKLVRLMRSVRPKQCCFKGPRTTPSHRYPTKHTYIWLTHFMAWHWCENKRPLSCVGITMLSDDNNNSSYHLETQALQGQVKFNFISFTLRPFSKDLFTRTVTTRHHQHYHSHENTMSEADSFDSPYFGIKLLFCYITLTTISFWNECAMCMNKIWARACALCRDWI